MTGTFCACCDELWLVADKTVRPFDGDLDDYRVWLREQRAKPVGTKAGAETPSRKVDKRAEAEERQRLANARKPTQKRVDAIEKEIARLSGTRDTLDAWLASEAAYSAETAVMLGEKTRQRGEVAAKISALEDEWMEKNEEMQWTP